MIQKVLSKVLGARTFTYYKTQVTHEITSVSKLAGFAVPLGLAVGWCAAPAMGDGAIIEMIGLPSNSDAAAGIKFKFEDAIGDTMPVPK